jgi:hypothetical protein
MRREDDTSIGAAAGGCGVMLLSAVAGSILGYAIGPEYGFAGLDLVIERLI